MDIYKVLSEGLLTIESKKGDEFLWFSDYHQRLSFGFRHRKEYSGLMARIAPEYRPRARDKQGYFDIIGITGRDRNITHDALISRLLLKTTLEKCQSVWRGIWPTKAENPEEINLLAALAILMFEQEINFGNEVWQRHSRFSPNASNPNFRRPRDMLMGYITIAFTEGIERLDDFKNARGLLMPPEDKKVLTDYFHSLRNDERAEALMTGSTLKRFNQAIADKELNPHKY